MSNKSGFKAFSLIELSIVILIIGILIAGVTQSSRLIKQFRIQTARNLTQSSPIYSIRDLTLWLESSSTSSFLEAETENGLPVSTWYDINPFLGTRYNFSSSSTKRPFYYDDGINGVPALKFDGTNDSMTLSPELNLGTTTTAFVVFKPSTATENGMLLSTTSNSGGAYQIIRYQGDSATALTTWNGVAYNATAAASDKAQIVVFTQNNTAAQFYRNGTALTAGTVNSTFYLFSQIGELDVNDSGPFDGYIAEIIIYSRVLKTEERRAIEAYLGKKYGIAVS